MNLNPSEPFPALPWQLPCSSAAQQASTPIRRASFTFLGAVVPLGLSDVTVLAVLAVEAGGVVQAANALPAVRPAHAG